VSFWHFPASTELGKCGTFPSEFLYQMRSGNGSILQQLPTSVEVGKSQAFLSEFLY